MIQIDIPELMRPFPRFLRKHSLIKAFLRLSPDSAMQRISFNNNAHAWVDLSGPEARNVFLTRSFEPVCFGSCPVWRMVKKSIFFSTNLNEVNCRVF